MVRKPVFIFVLILAGVLGIAGSTAIALSFLDNRIGTSGLAALFTYFAGFLVLLLVTANGTKKTAGIWLARGLLPLPMAIIVFFALRFFAF